MAGRIVGSERHGLLVTTETGVWLGVAGLNGRMVGRVVCWLLRSHNDRTCVFPDAYQCVRCWRVEER